MDPKKRHAPQQKQENVSRKQLESFLEEHEFVTADISPDLGEDVLVRIYDKGISTGLSFYVQLKSVDEFKKYLLKSGDISYPFEVKDLEHWAISVIPVFLVIWDVKHSKGWWIWINDAITYLQENNPNWEKNKTANVHLSSKNQIDESGLSNIRHLIADLYYPIISKGKDLSINARFSFPQTPEGKTKLNELQQHFAKGDEVELDGKYIELFDFPDWWKRLYGDFKPSEMYLKITPNRSNAPRPTKIEFISDIVREEIPYVELWITKQGEEEITLTNDLQDTPIKFAVIVNKVSRQNQIKIHADLSNLDGEEALKILRIQEILSHGGRIELNLLDSVDLINIPIPPKSFPKPDQSVLEFVEKICQIQKTFGTKLKFPQDGSFTLKDVQAADELASIIEKGIYQQSGMIFKANILKPEIEKIIDGFTDGVPVYVQIEANESFVEILSQKIELGPMLQKIRGNLKMSLEEIRSWLNNASDKDSLLVQLVGVELHEEFERWIKNE